jgi:hypothetical protein
MSQGNTITSGFIDLATFDEIEKYLYGGADATAYFVRETRKSTWFTQVPVVLSRAAGSPAFNQEWSVSISRAGDYLLQSWLRLTVAEVALATPAPGLDFIRWTRNFMHNLIHECSITFNDLVAARFDNYHLDFWAAFTVPAGKRTGYANMVGSFDEMNNPATTLPEQTLNLPLPFFYGRDSGVALPTAALPYNEMRINFSFRDWSQLLVGMDSTAAPGSDQRVAVPSTALVAVPELKNVQVWSNYAIVSNDERKRMACAPRDILIEQVQTAPRQQFLANGNTQPNYDIRFSHAIKVLFFASRNNTWASEWSQYITSSPVASFGVPPAILFSPTGAADPIEVTSLVYENTQRLNRMGSDYFSLVNPYYHAPTIPTETGFHTYSYSLDFIQLDPMGSTNYGKLTNVSIMPEASSAAVTAAAGTGGEGADFPQKFEFIVTAVNNNIIRISGGALGFPVL